MAADLPECRYATVSDIRPAGGGGHIIGAALPQAAPGVTTRAEQSGITPFRQRNGVTAIMHGGLTRNRGASIAS
jgi:hypothetical protein